MKTRKFRNLLSAAFIAQASQLSAATVTVGNINSNITMSYPFGGPDDYLGEYQQVYASNVFSNSFQITSVAFARKGGADVDYTLSIGLGVTDRSPASPGTSYSGPLVTVFLGSVTTSFTPALDFDLVLPLTTPFNYDPSLGNLLLSVNILTASSGAAVGFAGEFGSSQMGRVFNADGLTGLPTSGPGAGLVTQFTGTAIPEPSAILMSGIGLLGLISRRFRKISPDLAMVSVPRR